MKTSGGFFVSSNVFIEGRMLPAGNFGYARLGALASPNTVVELINLPLERACESY